MAAMHANIPAIAPPAIPTISPALRTCDRSGGDGKGGDGKGDESVRADEAVLVGELGGVPVAHGPARDAHKDVAAHE